MISKYLIVIIRLKDIHNCQHKKKMKESPKNGLTKGPKA